MAEYFANLEQIWYYLHIFQNVFKHGFTVNCGHGEKDVPSKHPYHSANGHEIS